MGLFKKEDKSGDLKVGDPKVEDPVIEDPRPDEPEEVTLTMNVV